MRIAYQGAAGAYSEAAAQALFPNGAAEPHESFEEAFASLEDGGVEAAVVPVENTHAGAVADVYDLLRRHRSLRIVAEAMLRVRHCLLGVPGAALEDVRVARSHPQALAQVEEFLHQRGIRPEVAYDTAGAAAQVARGAEKSVAAIASRHAAERYGLVVLAESIETSTDNITRFFALARAKRTSPFAQDEASAEAGPSIRDEVTDSIPRRLRAGAPKTSLAYAAANVPGSLVRTLQPFATAGLQLAKIESRPSRVAPWDYVFYLDFEGDPAVSPAAEALALMRTCCEWVHVLGTYPAATEVLEPD